MFIHASGEYLPERVVDNDYFARLTGRPSPWFEQSTGIRQRRRAGEGENANSMAVAAVKHLVRTGDTTLDDVDLHRRLLHSVGHHWHHRPCAAAGVHAA